MLNLRATTFYTGAHKVRRLDGLPNSPIRKSREDIPVKDNFELEVLQIQYKELKEKVCDFWVVCLCFVLPVWL